MHSGVRFFVSLALAPVAMDHRQSGDAAMLLIIKAGPQLPRHFKANQESPIRHA